MNKGFIIFKLRGEWLTFVPFPILITIIVLRAESCCAFSDSFCNPSQGGDGMVMPPCILWETIKAYVTSDLSHFFVFGFGFGLFVII